MSERTVLRIKKKKEEERVKLKLKKNKNTDLSRLDRGKLDASEDLRLKLIIMSFRRMYETYLREEGVAPDEFIEDTVNKIVQLNYFRRMVSNKPDFIREKLKEINYDRFMEFVIETPKTKINKMGLSRKCKIGADNLLELLTFLKIENDEKVKLKHNMMDLKSSAILLKNNMRDLFNMDDTLHYQKPYWFRRAYAIKEGTIIARGFEMIEDNDDLKGSIIMIEYENSKFLSIPYRIFKKLSTISKIELDYKIIHNLEGGFTHADISLEVFDDDNEQYNDTIVWYQSSITAENVFEIILAIMTYEEMFKAFDLYANITGECMYVGDEHLKVYLDGYPESIDMKYEKFINKYFPQLRF